MADNFQMANPGATLVVEVDIGIEFITESFIATKFDLIELRRTSNMEFKFRRIQHWNYWV